MWVVQTLIRGHQSGGKDEGTSVGVLIGAINRFGVKSSHVTNTKVIGHDLGKSKSSSREFT